MTNDALAAELKTELETLLAEADAKSQLKGPGRAMSEAERTALLWVGYREEGPPVDWADRPGWSDPRRRVQ